MKTRNNPPLWLLLLSCVVGMAIGGALFYTLTDKARLVAGAVALAIVAVGALIPLLCRWAEAEPKDRDEE